MKRALVTGASGYIGGVLARDLARDGVEVRALVRAESDTTGLEGVERLSTFVYDGSPTSLDAALDGGVDAVMHLAGLYVYDHAPADVRRLVDGNVLLTTQLLDASTRHRTAAFVNAGTFWQFAPDGNPAPNTLYAVTKHAGTQAVAWFARAGLPAVTLVLYDVYGAGDRRRKLLTLLAESVHGPRLAMSPGRQRLDLVHVSDVVGAFRAAAEAIVDGSLPGEGETYCVTTGRPRELREIVATFAEVAKADPKIEWGGRPYRRFEVMEPWIGPSLPGWSPTVELRDGIAGVLREDGLLGHQTFHGGSPDDQ